LLGLQLELPKCEAVDAQVVVITGEIREANGAWADKLGLTYPVLSDRDRVAAKAYGVLYDDPTLLNDPATIILHMRPKYACFVIDRAGVIRYAVTPAERGETPMSDEELRDAVLRVLGDSPG
jgi:peroxiredoxin